MNDIVIYCQRNATILKAQEEDDRAVAAAGGATGAMKDEENDEDDDDAVPSIPPRRASPPPPPQPVPDARTLKADMERAVDTASLLVQMIDAGTEGENQEVLQVGTLVWALHKYRLRDLRNLCKFQQLYEDTKAFQVQLHQLVNNNMGMEEELLGTVV